MKYLPHFWNFLALVLLTAPSLSAKQVQHPASPCHLGELWSEQFGSAAGANTVAPGDFVHIPAGQVILIDEDTVDLGGLYVEGTLAFDDCVGGNNLNSAYILVTGVFQVGWKDGGGVIHEYTKNATITLIDPFVYNPTVTCPPQIGPPGMVHLSHNGGKSGSD